MAFSATGHSISRFMNFEPKKQNNNPIFHYSYQHQRYQVCKLSMNGCNGDSRAQVGTIETRSLAAVPTPALAVDQLNFAINDLKSVPAPSSSGIIRLQVPFHQQTEAIDWLYSQNELLPRCFFSGRSSNGDLDNLINRNGHCFGRASSVVSVAGVGSAVFFRKFQPFTKDDWRSIKRFLSKECPLIRAYGAIRFDAGANVSPEWEAFGSFYFMVPQVEFNELEESSMLAANVAWDDSLSWTWQRAIIALQDTMAQISSYVVKLRKEIPKTNILSYSHVPNITYWDNAVKRALQIMDRRESSLTKVVLARSSRVVTEAAIDPLTWLACLQVGGENAYQFCLQPPNAPAFIGNTPEQLFQRKSLSICSEALAGTRARGLNRQDLEIELDLLTSPKDDLEFTIVRESIRRKLEAVCDIIKVEPKKAIRKLPRVQHLFAKLAGTLRSEDDEVTVNG